MVQEYREREIGKKTNTQIKLQIGKAISLGVWKLGPWSRKRAPPPSNKLEILHKLKNQHNVLMF